MEERWWPLVWLIGALGGYLLFMRHHPLRSAFATAFELARNNLTIVASLALLYVGAVGWRSWQETGLGSENTVALSISDWSDLLTWLAFAHEDLRNIIWYCVPLDVAFIIGTPLACLTCWYWLPRLWEACAGQSGRWLAVTVFAVYGLALWWWSQRLCEVLGLSASPVPPWDHLRQGLAAVGEIVFAVVLVCFFQLVLILGAYRSHGSGESRCRLKEATDWGLKFFPRVALAPLIVLLAMGINELAETQLDLTAAPVWDGFKLVLLLVTAAMPICVLLLQDLNLWESLLASFRFLLRTGWRYLWFLFLCLTHFFLLRLSESYLLASVLTHETAVIVWYVVAALAKAALVMWFVNAFCLYFCIDVSQRQNSKKTPRKPMKLAKLQARTRWRKGSRSSTHDRHPAETS